MAQVKFENRYSRLDQLLHRFAFSSGGLQVSLADVEDRIYQKQLTEVSIDRPVFVTALPRAGTTIVLNLLHKTDEFVSHTYRSMPFVLCPLFWERFSKSLRSREQREIERAHGDGLAISVDSPEAFEEVIWHHFWKPHYLDNCINPWRTLPHLEFENFLQSHLRKQILLAGADKHRRYLSKNNLNIARLNYLRSIFPDALIVIPFRRPVQHASSLLKQHLHFLHTHKEDKFSKDYMRGIGHFDFGVNFLPVNFDNWLQDERHADANTLAFWIEYWIAAYRHLLNNIGESTSLLSFEKLTLQPEATLQQLANSLELEQPAKLVSMHTEIKRPPAHSVDQSSISSTLLNEANRLYDEIMAQADYND